MNTSLTQISDAELSALTDAIHKRYGVDFSNYATTSLKRGFARIIIKRKLGSLVGLWSKILRDREFFILCIDDLLVNLTELFRNPEIWNFIGEEILGEYKGQKEVSMWHAGCSTGEEVYTMAIVLHQKLMLHKSKTLASDLSIKALVQAVKGEFNSLLLEKYKKSFAKYSPDSSLDQYFTSQGKQVSVNSFLRKHISFVNHNLVMDPIPKEEYDIIFCRNVMIYFDQEMKSKVLKKLHGALKPGGYFIVGYYDMLPDISRELFELINSGMKVYRKR